MVLILVVSFIALTILAYLILKLKSLLHLLLSHSRSCRSLSTCIHGVLHALCVIHEEVLSLAYSVDANTQLLKGVLVVFDKLVLLMHTLERLPFLL